LQVKIKMISLDIVESCKTFTSVLQVSYIV